MLISKLLAAIPERFNCYYEPFLGSGALFFALRPRRAVLADVNEELITFYQALKTDPNRLYRSISNLGNDRDTYYAIRSSSPRTQLRIATRLFYLNKTCFNGLYRTNRAGTFNVPFGNNGRTILPDKSRFVKASTALRQADLESGDFEKACCNAKQGDVVFLDPPYTVAHNNNGFIKYNASLFSWQDQLRLRGLVDTLVARGVFVLMTNADHDAIRTLYQSYRIGTLTRRSALSARLYGRKEISELLITAT